MKRLLSILLGLLIALPACSLSEDLDLSALTTEQLAELQSRIQAEIDNRPEDYDLIITHALTVLKEGWREEYAKYSQPGTTYHVDVRSVRVIRIKEELGEKESAVFENIKYLVEFLLYDDYMSTAAGPGHNANYLDLTGVNCVVIIDRDNNMVLAKNNPLRTYSNKTYNYDYSTIIEEVIDFHEQYNQLIDFSF